MSNVTKYLNEHDVNFVALGHRRALTALEEAAALGVPPGEVAKTVVLDTSTGHAIAVIPATRRLDLSMAATALSDELTRIATESEIERDFPQFELGAVPPIASLTNTPVYVDSALMRNQSIVFASGRQTESVRMDLADLLAEPSTMVRPLTHGSDEPADD